MTLSPATRAEVRLRPATPDDAPLLADWDRLDHVVASLSEHGQIVDRDWAFELAAPTPESHYLIAETLGRSIGVVQSLDPHLDPDGYWGDIEPDLRALDIWIGPKAFLGRGYGTAIMTLALNLCFTPSAVKAVLVDPLASNTRAHDFYRRLGFAPEGRRLFDADDCLVHRLTRSVWMQGGGR